MERYLNQFKLPAIPRMMLEQFIFGMASRVIVGYQGGMWEDVNIGTVPSLKIPGSAERITLRNIHGGEEVETDAKTASAAFTFCATNWYWHSKADTLTEAQHTAFMQAYEAQRDAVYADGNPNGINPTFSRSRTSLVHNKGANDMKQYEVFLNGRKIDKVYFPTEPRQTPEQVRQALIDERSYCSNITIREQHTAQGRYPR